MTEKQIQKFSKKSVYNKDKTVKKENFNFLGTLAEEGQIVFTGDSIIELWPLNELFPGLKKETGKEILNRGISGDTSDRLLERLKSNICAVKPSIVYILIGTNDHGMRFSSEYIISNYEKIINTIKKECPNTKIFIQSILPVKKEINKLMVGRRKNRSIIKINKLLSELAEDTGCIYVDVYELMLDAIDEFNEKYTYDGLHPNAQGFSVISKEAERIILDTLHKGSNT